MADPIFWNSKILLAKIEGTYGVDPTAAAANGILVTNVELNPMEGNDVSRELEYPWFGGQPEVPTELRVQLTFSTELAGSGAAGTAPAWGPLARACGMAEVIVPATSVTYSPITDNPESVTFYFWVGDTRHIITGVRGTGVTTVNANGIPTIRWTFTGLFTTPTQAGRTLPDLSAFQTPLVANNTNTPDFTINGVDMVMREFSMNLNNQVVPRLLVNREEILITGRDEEISAKVEAMSVNTFNPYALSQNQTSVAVNLVHGTAAGNIVTVNAPTCQLKRLTGYEQQDGITEWPLSLKPLAATGNDQFTITLT